MKTVVGLLRFKYDKQTQFIKVFVSSSKEEPNRSVYSNSIRCQSISISNFESGVYKAGRGVHALGYIMNDVFLYGDFFKNKFFEESPDYDKEMAFSEEFKKYFLDALKDRNISMEFYESSAKVVEEFTKIKNKLI